MCGIIGIINSSEGHHMPPESQQQMRDEALALEAVLEQRDPTSLAEKLQAVQARVSMIPSFPTSFALGSDSTLRESIERLKTSLRLALDTVSWGQQNSKSFQELEQWNELGLVCRDMAWRLEQDLLAPQEELYRLCPPPWNPEQKDRLQALWAIEFILRGLQRLEIRGRDSGGISVMVHFPSIDVYRNFANEIEQSEHKEEWDARRSKLGLGTGSICGDPSTDNPTPTLSFLYKEASEVGTIGQNVKNIRDQYQQDPILLKALELPGIHINPLAHTRWASNGIINVYNAHPQGNDTEGMKASETRLFAVLNGDIDNFAELREAFAKRTGHRPPGGVTTDAKIIPLMVEEKYRQCGDLREAFRITLQDFEGSFAIGLHHLDMPEKAWLGIGGSGQSLYVGVHENSVCYASELYGVVEATPDFVKLDGEREREPGNPSTRGQMLEVSIQNIGEPRPFQAWSFDGTPLTEEHLPIRKAQITTRDINIADYPHFFLKEISESVESVRKTLHGRFFLERQGTIPFRFRLDESTVPQRIIDRLSNGSIQHVYCIGQGTAAVAAQGVARAFQEHIGGQIHIVATKASELSGHMLTENMEDTLVIAVSQSGTTTDTNRTVDLVRQRGAQVLAILNRRNSDLAFKADGVMYTSDGRDVEMSVASTKAFYSQVTAGVLLSLYLSYRSEIMDVHRVHDGLRELLQLPSTMARVLAQGDKIRDIAYEHALTRRYWAVVGSGSNQIAAHEIRIKLSELCYKSMSCDTIEDKKHIDLSAEPLMLVCAAGLDEANLSDSVKEVAIFKAHESLPIVIASNGAERFEPYATAVVKVPEVSPHLSPVLTTIVGHLFGYHAACAIENQSVALRKVRSSLLQALPTIDNQAEGALNPEHPSELVPRLREVLRLLQTSAFNSALEVQTAVQLSLKAQQLLYSAHEEALGEATSPYELAQELMSLLTEAVRELSRPIDAIKHQAKTVTVGISRPTPSLKGSIGDVFRDMQLDPSLLLWRNLSYLISAEPLVAEIPGATLYSVTHLDENSHPTPHSKIFKEFAIGMAANIPSRTDSDPGLKGSKWLAIKENSVQVGIGRADGRQIAIIPLRGELPQEGRILLLHLTFNEQAPLQTRLQWLRTRGHLYDQFRAAVTEFNLSWSDQLLLQTSVQYLFDDSPDRFVASLSSLSATTSPSYTSLPAIKDPS